MLRQASHKCGYVCAPLTPIFTLDHQNVISKSTSAQRCVPSLRIPVLLVLRNAQPRNGQEAATSGGGVSTLYTKRVTYAQKIRLERTEFVSRAEAMQV